MRVETLLMSLILLTASCSRMDVSHAAPSNQRVRSTLGFSFLPPGGLDWIEEFEKNQITYTKKTNPALVTFYAGALETEFRTSFSNSKALLDFVRLKKNEWGSDGRYTNISSSFILEPAQYSCVRYRMSAHDHGARNRGNDEFMLLEVAGRFCTHPQNPRAAVDIFYSQRHIPSYEASSLDAEGEAFLDSLAF